MKDSPIADSRLSAPIMGVEAFAPVYARPDTKSARVKRLIQDGNWPAALSILRLFRLEFTKSQKRLIEISADVLNGHAHFYEQLGIDTEQVVSETKAMLVSKYTPVQKVQ